MSGLLIKEDEMYPQERYEKILLLIENSSFVKAADLAKICNVSLETIRRDLEYLEKENFIKRVHGGAAIEKINKKYPAFLYREKENSIEKQGISEKALQFINEGDSIALDSGTTTLELAKVIKNKFKKLTIVTNSLKILNEFYYKEDFTIILAGGIFKLKEFSLFGSLTEEIFRKFHVNTSFVSASGISLSNGITDLRFDELQIQKIMLEISEKKIILATSSKFEVTCLLKLCDFEQIDTIITDSNLDDNIFDKFISNKINVLR